MEVWNPLGIQYKLFLRLSLDQLRVLFVDLTLSLLVVVLELRFVLAPWLSLDLDLSLSRESIGVGSF